MGPSEEGKTIQSRWRAIAHDGSIRRRILVVGAIALVVAGSWALATPSTVTEVSQHTSPAGAAGVQFALERAAAQVAPEDETLGLTGRPTLPDPPAPVVDDPEPQPDPDESGPTERLVPEGPTLDNGIPAPVLGLGSTGEVVLFFQQLLVLHGADPEGLDGVFGPNTLEALHAVQAAKNLPVSDTTTIDLWKALLTVPAGAEDRQPFPLPTLAEGSQGPVVAFIQGLLTRAGFPVTVDGVIGPATAAAISAFQGAKQLAVDGVLGPETWLALLAVPAPS